MAVIPKPTRNRLKTRTGKKHKVKLPDRERLINRVLRELDEIDRKHESGRYTKKQHDMKSRASLERAINPRKANPWAVCMASVGRRRKAKYERCVIHVKEKQGKE